MVLGVSLPWKTGTHRTIDGLDGQDGDREKQQTGCVTRMPTTSAEDGEQWGGTMGNNGGQPLS